MTRHRIVNTALVLLFLASLGNFAAGCGTSHPAPVGKFGTVVNPPSPAQIGALSTSENLKDVASTVKSVENLGLVSTAGAKLGKEALASNTTGNENVAVGLKALNANTEGKQNVAVGALTMKVSKTAEKETAVGENALEADESGQQNAAFGLNALQKNKTGEKNAAFGATAMARNESGSRNAGFGYEALVENSTGKGNTAGGYAALNENRAGSENTAFGDNALGLSGISHEENKNTAIGFQAGAHNEGEKNVFIGYFAGEAFTGSNALFIANGNTETPLIRGDFSAKTLTITGRMEPGTVAGTKPAKPAEGEASAANEISALRKRSCAITGNGAQTKFKCEHKLATRLISSVRVQKAEAEEPGEVEPEANYKVKVTGTASVEVVFTAAPSAGTELFITVAA